MQKQRLDSRHDDLYAEYECSKIASFLALTSCILVTFRTYTYYLQSDYVMEHRQELNVILLSVNIFLCF